MKRCLQLANKGLGSVQTNPLVGSVIVHNNVIIGEGYHQKYGNGHAEVNAIDNVKNKDLLKESTLYVNLEPCAHTGKTPPCSDLIIRYNIPKVVIGCVDSFSEVAGKGIEKMKRAGIDVIMGVMEKESRKINKRFFTFHEQKRPYVILKWAESQDGFIAPIASLHDKQRWITDKSTQVLVHKWRSEEHAILVGYNTVKKDNPSLTVREYDGNNPVRVIIDKELSLPNNKKIFNKDAKTIIFNSIKQGNDEVNYFEKINFNDDVVSQILKKLYSHNIQSVIVEGGAKTLQLFINNGADEIRQLKANTHLYSGIAAPANLEAYNIDRLSSLGVDELRVYYRNH